MMRLVAALAFALAATASRAATELPITMHRDAAAKITVGSCFDHLPPAGYAPVDVKITNHSDRASSWDFDFTSPGYSSGQSAVSYSRTLGVPAKTARTFKLVVPLVVREPNSYLVPLSVNVSGPGTVLDSGAAFPNVNRTGKPVTPFIALSEPLGARFGGQLEEEIKKGNHQLVWTKFRAPDLPEDWRTLVGIAGVWLTASELAQLAPPQRGALREWMARGGTLFVCGVAELGPELRSTGFGKAVAVPSEDLGIASTAATIHGLAPTLVSHLTDSYSRDNQGAWKARESVGNVEVNAPLLIVLMAIFAVVVGPLNLFVFAPRGRRHRLFWTTPAISVIASAVLFVLIVFQDGFGGWGLRTALVHILPGERKQVVLQEQLARTGVVNSSQFETRDPTFIAPIALERNVLGRKHQYHNTERLFGGDWFASRMLQAHWLESVTSTRAEVTLLNAAELRDPAIAPVVLSSIGAPLAEFYYFDEHGGVWSGVNLRAGEKATLTRTETPQLLSDQAGPRLRAAFENLWQRPGYFYASSTDRADLIDTLPAIRWQYQRVIYVGQASTAATP